MTAEPSATGRVSAFDGVRLVYQSWHAPPAKGGVLVVHGFGEHGRRYGYLVDALVPAGLSVMTFDMRGHGGSGGRRGHIDHFDDYGKDVGTMIDFAREQLGSPLMMIAHSMGGLVAVHLCQTAVPEVAALVLSNPWLQLKMPVPAWKVVAAKGLSRLVPILPMPAGVDYKLISSDPAEAERYHEDPEIIGDGTARWGAELLAHQASVFAAPGRFAFAPTLVQLGEKDGIIDSAASRGFFSQCASEDCRVEVYEGGFHELYNEAPAIRERVLADLRDFLVARAAKG